MVAEVSCLPVPVEEVSSLSSAAPSPAAPSLASTSVLPLLLGVVVGSSVSPVPLAVLIASSAASG